MYIIADIALLLMENFQVTGSTPDLGGFGLSLHESVRT